MSEKKRDTNTVTVALDEKTAIALLAKLDSDISWYACIHSRIGLSLEPPEMEIRVYDTLCKVLGIAGSGHQIFEDALDRAMDVRAHEG